MVFHVCLLAGLGRLVCTGRDFVVVMLLFLLYFFVMRDVTGIGHVRFFRKMECHFCPKIVLPK